MPENENHRTNTETLDSKTETSGSAPTGKSADAQTNIPPETRAAADIARTVSPKRRAANQAAALKSTGPRTPQGKRRAAFNSFQHGAFASEDHILHQALDRAGYDAQAFDARRQELLDDWQPGGAQQRQVIGDLAWLYWLRDRARVALLEMQARSAPRLELERDWRRFSVLHRPVSFDHSDFYPDGGATADPSPDKFKVMGEFLDDLESMITQRKWSDEAMGRCEYNARTLAEFVWGKAPNTARGREFLRLWDECAEKRAKADDPRVAQLLAWIAEERAALVEEEALGARQQALDVEQPEETGWPELRPLGEAWQAAERRLQQMERQIDAKIRLLLRLEKRAQEENIKPSEPGKPSEHNASYKPDESVARTSVAEVRGFSSGTRPQAADLKCAGPRYLLPESGSWGAELKVRHNLPLADEALAAEVSGPEGLSIGERLSWVAHTCRCWACMRSDQTIGSHTSQRARCMRHPADLKVRPPAAAREQLQNRGTNPRRPLESTAEAFGPTWGTDSTGLAGQANRAAAGLRASL